MKMRLFCLISLALATSSGFAATEALTLPAGYSLIADHLDAAGGNTPEQWGAFVENEIAKWTKIAKLAGMKAD